MRTGTAEAKWLLGDHLGSQSYTVSYAGTSEEGEVRYKPWGEDRYTSGTTPTTFRYTGQRSEAALGIYFYGTRWYDPSLGRFLQADTLVPNPNNPQDWDRYSYVRNNPLRYTDSSGNTPWDVVDVIFFFISVYDFAHNPTWGNAGWLLLDTVGLAPVIPSVSGYIRRGAQAIGLYDEVVQFAARYGDNIYDFAKVAHKRGAVTLLRKFLSATTDIARRGAEFELEYALKHTEDIVEIGRKIPGGEIDFVLKGNVYVNVKNYNWANPSYKTPFVMKKLLEEFLNQASNYKKYADKVKFVFKESVPNEVRKALEAAGVIVEVIP